MFNLSKLVRRLLPFRGYSVLPSLSCQDQRYYNLSLCYGLHAFQLVFSASGVCCRTLLLGLAAVFEIVLRGAESDVHLMQSAQAAPVTSASDVGLGSVFGRDVRAVPTTVTDTRGTS